MEAPAPKADRARGEAFNLVVSELRAAIVSGRLPPGSRIGQVEVAQSYGTSRLPVRLALRQLHHEGLVRVTPNAGARVSEFDAAELEEIYRIREQLEPMLIAESAPGLTDGQIATCCSLVEEMERVERSGEDWVDRWLELDRRFHQAAFAGAEMSRTLRLVDDLWNMAAYYRLMYAGYPGVYELAQLEHRLILDALERRDAEDAERLLSMHLRRTRLGLAERVAAAPLVRDAVKRRRRGRG